MPFSFINTVASWMLKKRIHQIELFEKYPLDVQNEELKKLIQFQKTQNLVSNMSFHQLIIMKPFPRGFQVLLMKNIFQSLIKLSMVIKIFFGQKK